MQKTKIINLILAFVLIILCLCCGCNGCTGCNGCNYGAFDQIYRFDEAIIRMPDGSIIQGKIQQWCDYEGDQLQIKIDGIWYLVHANNAVMIAHE